jgi:hypothetical protein
MRAAWQLVEEFSSATLERARALPPEQLDVSVDGEWSYIQTLRHLVFATDRWVTGPVLGEADQFHPLGMPNPPYDALPPGVFDIDAMPPLDEVVAVRRDRMDRVAGIVGRVTSSELRRQVPSPNGGSTSVTSCLHIVLREEWWHDQYARRDLTVLEGT